MSGTRRSDASVQISTAQRDYLVNAAFLPRPLAAILKTARPVGKAAWAVEISRDTAEQFRSVLTERLASVGFDPEYEPTGEGKMLEELIDCFYIA
jgi:hypothetical protein